MTTLYEAAQQALEQLKINRTNFRKGPSKSICKMLAGGNDEAIADLEAALAEAAEPVAWLAYDGAKQLFIVVGNGPHDRFGGFPVYASPTQRKPLTEDEIEQEYKKGYADGYAAGYDNGDSEGFTRGTDSMVPASLAAWRAETKPLTEAQIYAAIKGIDSLKAAEVARAIERAHGIGDKE